MDLLKIAEYAFMAVGALNVLIAGLKAMGWTKAADECTKIENAISAMREALLKQILNKGDKDEKITLTSLPTDKPSDSTGTNK